VHSHRGAAPRRGRRKIPGTDELLVLEKRP
jgi:hypothetical protein